MLEAIMIASANDAAVRSEHVAGSTAAFVELMNARAKALGLTDTVYQSVHGCLPRAARRPD